MNNLANYIHVAGNLYRHKRIVGLYAQLNRLTGILTIVALSRLQVGNSIVSRKKI